MSYIKKLVVGTANFGQKYNGHQVPKDELEKIWELCIDSGIEYADTAELYNYQPPDWLKTITKIKTRLGWVSPYATLIHHKEDVPLLWPELYKAKILTMALTGKDLKVGISIYGQEEISCLPYDIIQMPYSVLTPKLGEELRARAIEIHVRKVFTEKNGDKCVFLDALQNPYVNFVVIGIDNAGQLAENIMMVKRLDGKNV